MLHKTSVSPTVIHGSFHLFSTLSLSKINMNLSQKNGKKKEEKIKKEMMIDSKKKISLKNKHTCTVTIIHNLLHE